MQAGTQSSLSCSGRAVSENEGGRPIVALSPYFLPGFKGGGPIRSLCAMARELSPEFDFRVVAGDRDCGDTRPYETATTGGWTTVNGISVWYTPPGLARWSEITSVLRCERSSVVYVNDFFSVPWGLWPLLVFRLHMLRETRLLIAPRGQFSTGALSIKAGKKSAFLQVARATTGFRGAFWHATSEAEVEEIQRVAGSGAKVYFAPNIPGLVPEVRSGSDPPALRANTRLVFVSRIVPKKNLLRAVRILSKVSLPVTFDIYGPIEDRAYWALVQSEAKALPGHVTWSYRGPLDPDQVQTVYSSYDAFLFPTLGENFGHVIFEALANGCLPILSDRTPWSELEERGCGWAFALNDDQAFVGAVEEVCGLSGPERAERRTRARDYALEYLAQSKAVVKTREMFRAIAGVSPG